MLIPGFTEFIYIKLIFAEHHYVPIFNTENHIRGGRYEGIRSGILVDPHVECGFSCKGSYKIHIFL
jgi:hypothetical protein